MISFYTHTCTFLINQFSKLPCLIIIKIHVRHFKSKHKAYLQTPNVHRHGTMARVLVVEMDVQDDWPRQNFRRPNG